MIPYSFNPMGVDAVQELSDLDILRQIRNANPDSQLPSLWLDSEDPYTQWEGVTWNGYIVIYLELIGLGITSIPYLNKLSGLQYIDTANIDSPITPNAIQSLDLSGLGTLEYPLQLDIYNCGIVTLNLTNTVFSYINCSNNNIASLSTFTLIPVPNDVFDFTSSVVGNRLPDSEIDRLRNLGFSDSRLLPQNP